MRVLITGGLGFLGQMLTQELRERGSLTIDGSESAIDEIVLLDATDPVSDFPEHVRFVKGDVRDAAALADALDGKPTTVFHLASIVSSEAEERWDAAVDGNIGGLLSLVRALSHYEVPPRLVFASSVAAVRATPGRGESANQQSTYGMTKEVCELILEDASRLGIVDARVARLPTVIIRSHAANRAASGYASALFREVSHGRSISLPVPADQKILVIGVDAVVGGLVAVSELDAAELDGGCIVNLPGLSVSVDELVAAAIEAYGPEVRDLISYDIDPAVVTMMNKWAVDWSGDRAIQLGLPHDNGLSGIVEQYNQLTMTR